MRNAKSSTLKIVLLLVVATVIVFFLIRAGLNPSNPSADTDSSTHQATTTQLSERGADTDPVKQYQIATTTNRQTTDRYKIEVELPQGTSTAAKSARAFLRTRRADFTQFIAENTTGKDSSYQPTYTFTARLDTYQTNRNLSFVYTINEYTGGVNANTSVRTFVEDKSNRQLGSLADMIASENRSDFTANIKGKLRDTLKSQVFPEAVSNLTFKDFDDFYVNGDRIVVLFAPYTVAPGAAGIVTVSVER
jgi:hypothetical protein